MSSKNTASPPETLPARWYHDPEVHVRECKAIFQRHWTLVARMDQFTQPGDYVAGEVAGRPVFVLKGKSGALTAFHNVCRHRAGPLLDDGAGRCSMIRCRYHGWLYSEDGRLRRAPGLEIGRDIDADRFALHPVKVAAWNGLVFACLDTEAPGLECWLGDIVAIAKRFPAVADMKFLGEITRAGRADWKAYADNACEGYHVGTVHKTLSKAVGTCDVTVKPYEIGQFIGFDVTYRPTVADKTRQGRGFWIYKFPNLLIHFSDYAFNAERVIPQGPGRVTVQRWFWCDERKASALGIEPGNALTSARQVIGEDMDMCEKVQRNLETGVYDTGLMSIDHEPGTIYVQSLVRQALTC